MVASHSTFGALPQVGPEQLQSASTHAFINSSSVLPVTFATTQAAAETPLLQEYVSSPILIDSFTDESESPPPQADRKKIENTIKNFHRTNLPLRYKNIIMHQSIQI